MSEHANIVSDEGRLNPMPGAGPELFSETGDHHGVATTLGDLFTALQDVTDDDHLVLAAMTDLMRRGVLKRFEATSIH